MNTIENNIAYTLTEAARFLNVTVYELRAYIKENKIEAHSTGWSQRVQGIEIKRFVEDLKKIVVYK